MKLNDLFQFDSDLSKDLLTASPPVASAIHKIANRLTVLLDPGDEAWLVLDMDSKITSLRSLDRYGWLDRLLQAYIRYARQHEPERLQNLGLAVLDYSEAGYRLRLPASPMIGPICSPGYVASLARLFEDNQLDCAQLDWLGLESKRLLRAVDHWIGVNIGYDGKGI